MVKTARFARLPSDDEQIELSPLKRDEEVETPRVATTSNGYQHITNVLEESYRQPAWAEGWAFYLSRYPSSYCNWISIGCGFLAVFFGFLLLMGEVPSQVPFSYTTCRTVGNTVANVLKVSPWGYMTALAGTDNNSYSLYHDYRGRPRAAVGRHGAIAADHGRCSDMGLKIMQDGNGNSVDAMVTTTLCQGLMNPGASGIGGGHFAVIRTSSGSAHVVDAREVAPAAATEDMFKGKPPHMRLAGGLAVAVPLELKGLWTAHKMFGQKTWKNVVSPVIDLARYGFPAHPYLVEALNRSFVNITQFPDTRDSFLINEDGEWRVPRVNETCCKRPRLAELLEDVALSSPDVLYDGKYSEGFVADIQAAGGIITLDDLRGAEAAIKEPIRGTVMGMELITAPPPSSGVLLMPMLNILAGFPLPLSAAGFLGVHRVVEALKHGFALRMSLGDPGSEDQVFLNISQMLEDIVTPEYAATLRSEIVDDGILKPQEYGGTYGNVNVMPQDDGTSHLCITDVHGWAVALTSTINTGFGSMVTSKSTGILLNNEMDDFSTPDAPNVYGLHPSPSNFIRPGKKPLSSMSPAILEQDGKIRMVVGGSGGPTIISGVLQTIARHLLMGWHPFDAVANPRVHDQLLPEKTFAEQWVAHGIPFNVSEKIVKDLRRRGHNVTTFPLPSVTQAIVVDPDVHSMLAVSDPRKDGAPAVF